MPTITIYDFNVNKPTTLKGLSEYFRVVLQNDHTQYAGTDLKVFRGGKLKKLYVWGDKRYHGPALTFHLSVVKTTKIVHGEEVDVFYKSNTNSLLLKSDSEGVKNGLFDEYGYPTEKGWGKALKSLNLRMTQRPAKHTPNVRHLR